MRLSAWCCRATAPWSIATRVALVGQSFRVLYASVAELERIGKRMEPMLNASGRYADNRMMKRLDGVYGALRGETF